MDINEQKGYKEGSKKVFHLSAFTQGLPDIADDEIINEVVFELDPNGEDFFLQDAELQQIKLHFRSLCLCAINTWQEVTEGCINGEKIDETTWKIEASFLIDVLQIDFNFDANFVLQ